MVPEEIRKVPRPINTIVVDTNRNSIKRFAVKSRKGIIYKKGKNPCPINGEVVGYIINGVYVPKQEELSSEADYKSFGGAQFVWSLSQDILKELFQFYDVNVASQIYMIALTRILKKGITDRRIASAYESNFLSELLPNVSLSYNTISTLLDKLGRNYNRIKEFMRFRTSKYLTGHRIAVDGMLKQDNSIVNDLSDYSHKAKIKGIKEISVLYAYDIESKEIICGKVYPGNMLDSTAYRSFIEENNLANVIIVADKGFPPSQLGDDLIKKNDLSYLSPLKRNSTLAKENKMYEFNTVIKVKEKSLPSKKVKLGIDHFLYSFKDPVKAYLEELNYLKTATDSSFDTDEYKDKDSKFGTIVFESNKDMDLITVYESYGERWNIELVFKYYKSALELDETRVQNNTSVIGSEFINFLSSLITMRMINKFAETGLLKSDTYGNILDDLNQVAKCKEKGEWVYVRHNEVQHEILEKLEIIPTLKREPKPKGRPRKYPKEDKPKRPRGRPKKSEV